MFWKKIQGMIEFNQSAWLKPYIDMNTDLGKKSRKRLSEGTFLRWWIMQFLEKRWKMGENTEILNLSQQKEERTI